MATTISSVLGPIPTERLGYTLMHEHLQVGWAGWDLDGTWKGAGRGERLESCTKALAELAALGVKTFVDPCPMELGRDPEFMAEVSSRSGVNIVCSTGLYKEDLGLPSYFRQRSVEEIAALYIKELTEGIGSTGIKAGLIKCATGVGAITPNEEKALRAAARASAATGAPIITHTDNGSLGDKQLDLFLAEGAQPARIAIGHSDGTADLKYHAGILERGAYVSFDRIGLEFFMPDRIRRAVIAGLIGAGYGRQLFMSQDHACCWLGRTAPRPPEVDKLMANRRFTYIVQEFIPQLLAAGVSQASIQTIMVENPRRYFEGAR
ncbi:MAG: phosphotriesterase-related protein [Chloroflexi bacterium]|nr:phosphotriesterase-related protein [Chloroflexota bacterium]